MHRDRRARVAIIGFGRMGEVHARAVLSCPQADLVAACDPDEEARRRATEFRIPAFERLERMLEEARPDAVAVCTPPSSHAELVAACLRRGIHVLCEKPLTTDLASARQLWRLAAANGSTLLVATKFRHVEEVQAARRLLCSGEIGRVTGFRIEFSSYAPMAHRWYADRSISGGGVIIDNGCHAFDLVNFLFGGIRAVRVRLGDAPQGLAVEETASIEVLAPGGIPGVIELSWSRPSSGDEYMAACGENGSLRIGWQRCRLEHSAGETVYFGQAYDKATVHRRMMECFCRVIRGAEPPWIQPEESLLVAEAIEAAYRSCVSQAEELVAGPEARVAYA